MNARNYPKKTLLIAFLIETICVTYALKLTSLTGITSVLFSLSGIVIAVCFLLIPEPTVVNNLTAQKKFFSYRWLLTIVAFIATSAAAVKWMEDAPLDYHEGDMLPIIKIMSQRFLNGNWRHVYDIIPEIWGGMQPIYLPAMWLPFSLPVLLGIDLRWMTVLVLFIVSALFIWRIQMQHKKAPYLFFAAFLLIWWLLSAENSGLIPYTEEGVVIGFYSLLAIALTKKNAWLIGFATALCILSRYAIVGWLPAMIIYFTINKNYKKLLQFCLIGLVCFAVLVLSPFGWQTFLKLASIPSQYIGFTGRVWHDAPIVFKQSLGWAKFFGPKNIATQHYLLLVMSLFFPMLFMMIALSLQKKLTLTNHHLPFATLKITLVIFYTLVDVPYLYLFYTGSFVSLFLVTYLLAGDSIKNTTIIKN